MRYNCIRVYIVHSLPSLKARFTVKLTSCNSWNDSVSFFGPFFYWVLIHCWTTAAGDLIKKNKVVYYISSLSSRHDRDAQLQWVNRLKADEFGITSSFMAVTKMTNHVTFFLFFLEIKLRWQNVAHPQQRCTHPPLLLICSTWTN